MRNASNFIRFNMKPFVNGAQFSMVKYDDDPKWQRERRRRKDKNERTKTEWDDKEDEDRKASKFHRHKKRDWIE